MKLLTIEAYNKAEAEGRRPLDLRTRQMFDPGYFCQQNFPTHATSEVEIHHFADCMGEVRAFNGWDKAYFDAEEILLIKWLSQVVKNTANVTPASNLLSPWPIFRMVRHLSSIHGRKFNIFEGAAGCGYLGAYLINDGHTYTGFDITQGLYLWQHRLWRAVAGGNFAEIALNEETAGFQAIHMPWWEFAVFHKGFGWRRPYNIVICDSAFGEMHPFGYRYFIHAAKKMLEDSQHGIGCLLLTSIGDPKNLSEGQAIADLAALGFKLYRAGGVMVFGLPSFDPGWLKNLPAPTGLRLSDFMKEPNPLPQNYASFRFAGLC